MHDMEYYIKKFIFQNRRAFTVDELLAYLEDKNVLTCSRADLRSILFMFSGFYLDEATYILNSVFFENCIFSFKPTYEEIEKGAFILGHRGIPYLNPEFDCGEVDIYDRDTQELIVKKETTYSMNFLLDRYAFYGPGYDILMMNKDFFFDGNKDVTNPYNLPTSAKQTSWPFESITGGKDIAYGDRIICRVRDYDQNIIEVWVQKNDTNSLVISSSEIERQQWYGIFEKEMKKCFERLGPLTDMPVQLYYVERMIHEKISFTENCGAFEEFLEHTKLGFKPYGVETRIWKNDEEIPFAGSWNGGDAKEALADSLSKIIDNRFFFVIANNELYEEINHITKPGCHKFYESVFPKICLISNAKDSMTVEQVILNIKKRRDILKKKRITSLDATKDKIRRTLLIFFSDVAEFMCDAILMANDFSKFLSRDLILLSQLYLHLLQILIDLAQNGKNLSYTSEEVDTMLQGMEDTFEDLKFSMGALVKIQSNNGFKLYSDN